MKHFRELLIAVLIVAFFWAVFDGQLQRKKVSEFDAKEKRDKAKYDSVIELQHKSDLYAIQSATDANLARQEVKRLSHENEKFAVRVATLKRLVGSPIPSDAQIDSAARRLYKGR